MTVEGRVVVVTGAAKGIGLRIARVFAAGAEALALEADVTVTADVRHAVETVLGRWGRLDVLVNNAGGFSAIRRTEDIGEPEEIADAVLFLASDAARYVTGATLDVNGGLVMP